MQRRPARIRILSGAAGQRDIAKTHIVKVKPRVMATEACEPADAARHFEPIMPAAPFGAETFADSLAAAHEAKPPLRLKCVMQPVAEKMNLAIDRPTVVRRVIGKHGVQERLLKIRLERLIGIEQEHPAMVAALVNGELLLQSRALPVSMDDLTVERSTKLDGAIGGAGVDDDDPGSEGTAVEGLNAANGAFDGGDVVAGRDGDAQVQRSRGFGGGRHRNAMVAWPPMEVNAPRRV